MVKSYLLVLTHWTVLPGRALFRLLRTALARADEQAKPGVHVARPAPAPAAPVALGVVAGDRAGAPLAPVGPLG